MSHRFVLLIAAAAIASSLALPAASACCVHTTRTVAWAEYVAAPEGSACVAPAMDGLVGLGSCDLAAEPGSHPLLVLDASGRDVGFAWSACGEQGVGFGSGEAFVPEGCMVLSITLGPDATSGVIRRTA